MTWKTKYPSFLHKVYSLLFLASSTSPFSFLSFRTEEGECSSDLSGVPEPSPQPAAEGDPARALPGAGAPGEPDHSVSHPDEHGPPREPHHPADSRETRGTEPLPSPLPSLYPQLPAHPLGPCFKHTPLQPGAQGLLSSSQLPKTQVWRTQLFQSGVLLPIRDHVSALLLPRP